MSTPPRAYGNCTCSCHTGDGKLHVVPCCSPSDDDFLYPRMRTIPLPPPDSIGQLTQGAIVELALLSVRHRIIVEPSHGVRPNEVVVMLDPEAYAFYKSVGGV